MNFPRISIVTPSYNQADYLEETILSVVNQRYPNVEHIIIDGGSTDGSVEIIERHAQHLAYWVSEPDDGQTHAINKGIERATGDIVQVLCSDDLLLPGALYAVAHYFAAHPESRWVCGGSAQFGLPDQAPERVDVRVPRNATQAVYFDYLAPMPSHFWARELFEKHGRFDPRYQFCFDHEFYVRLLLGGEVCGQIAYPLSGYRLHANSKTVALKEKFMAEFKAIRQRYGKRIPARAAQPYLTRQSRWGRVGYPLQRARQAWAEGRRREALGSLGDLLRKYPVTVGYFGFKELERRLLKDKFRNAPDDRAAP